MVLCAVQTIPLSIAARLHDFQKATSAINPVFPIRKSLMIKPTKRMNKKIGIIYIILLAGSTANSES